MSKNMTMTFITCLFLVSFYISALMQRITIIKALQSSTKKQKELNCILEWAGVTHTNHWKGEDDEVETYLKTNKDGSYEFYRVW